MKISLEGRIDSNNASEIEAKLMEASPDIELDAKNLNYISSAGLRVLLKLRKKINKPLSILNVSSEVYDIFSVTGFTELLDVHRKMREVSVEGCDVLGEGANGKVYRLTRDEMIKVFKHNVPLSAIEAEREVSRKAFLLGVPCAIAFDTVKCGESYGTIYEMFNAGTLSERIIADGTRLPELAKSSALLLKRLHGIEVPEGQMPRASRFIHNTVDKLTGDFSPGEIAMMHAIYNAIPEENRFVHNDYHTKNVMESKGELMLIDLGDAGPGNPAIDLIRCCMLFKIAAKVMSNKADTEIDPFIGLTYRQMREFWEIFIDSYCGGKGTNALEERLEPYAVLMFATSALAHPLTPKEYRKSCAEILRGEIFPHYDELVKFNWNI
ncbi:MAG: phosphotransferase [Synergistaceae bacterium]|nr:phosphotransferase [Synergistaceae bacterium]